MALDDFNINTDPPDAHWTTRSKLQMWLESVDGTFHLRDAYEAMGAGSAEAKTRVRQALHREKGQSIESGGRYGTYRRIDRGVEWADLSVEDEGGPKSLDLHIGLGIGHLVRLFPGDEFVVAGETGGGKTGFAFDFALNNKDKFPVNYFSSEVNKEGMQDKAKKDRIELSRLKGFKFGMRYDHYEDVIVPGEINIIDYVKPPDIEGKPGFFAIAHLLQKIHRSLNGEGIALVCIQKDNNTRFGEGGSKTAHAANLYLTLHENKTGQWWAQIEKCKVRPELKGYGLRYEPRPAHLEAKTDWLPSRREG